MISTEKTFVYRAFGINILSEICLPELIELDSQNSNPDIVVEKCNLLVEWVKYDSDSRKKFVVKNNKVMFEVPNTAIFSIQAGQRISFSPLIGAEEDKIRLYILGTCMGIILLQRKVLPLHGSAIAINGKAYAFIGESGAGKSTLAASFIRKGYKLLSDDLIPILLSNENNPIVIPSYPQQKLWKESLAAFGEETIHYQPLFERETKFAIPVHSNFSGKPLPLAGIFELVKTDIETSTLDQLKGLERFRMLFHHTYRHSLIQRLKLTDWHFTESANILKKINVFQLKRSSKGFTAPELLTLILSSINEVD